MNKRTIVFLILFVSILTAGYSQRLTMVAIVDLPRVYSEFFRESRAVREFEDFVARVQRDIDRMRGEIQSLQTRHADAIARDNQSEITRLENDINRRTENLREFAQTRNTEIETRRRNLMQSDTFVRQVQDEMRYIGESEGFTMIFDIRNTPGIAWYRPTIDVTDRLIQSLRTRSNR
jgi:outer membrane protein